jgi:hypothetical protein
MYVLGDCGGYVSRTRSYEEVRSATVLLSISTRPMIPLRIAVKAKA